MTTTSETDIISRYYDAFNRGDMQAFYALLDTHIIHDINQGKREVGKTAFIQFMDRMNTCYKEQIADLVVMYNETGTRAAAEFKVYGTYLKTDDGLPEANGQTYMLLAGAFFEIKEGKVSRVTNYYNLNDWITQVK